MDQNILQQEERDWYNKALIENKLEAFNEKNNDIAKNKEWKLWLNDEEMAEWIREQRKHILFFDGASKNNPGRVGAGGLILDPNGKRISTYEWGLGEMSNNKAESYSFLLGTKILKKKGVKDPIITGDSAIIIVAMETGKEFKSSTINKISHRIKINTKNMGKIAYKHVLRIQDKDVDTLVNKAMKRQVGTVKENNKTYEENIP